MEQYDHIVVGSGISGLTATLLLAMTGHRVLLVEKAPRIGGSLARFRRKGFPFDTGFHFTGAFYENGILSDMLSVLDIRDSIKPIFLSEDQAHQFVFEAEGRSFALPCGLDRWRKMLKAEFPGEQAAVDRYFDMVTSVCERTTSMNLRMIPASPHLLDEDYLTLQSVLDDLTDDALLKAMLSGLCMCYGVKPSEVSFANHSRICMGMYESMARVERGGEAFVDAFRQRFESLDVAIRTGTHITEYADVTNDQVGRFVLSTGEEVIAKSCILTIHPKEILKTLPQERVSKAFRERVSDFESSAGFFSVFGIMKDGGEDGEDVAPVIVSLFPNVDINGLLDSQRKDDSALVIISGEEEVNGRPCEVVTAFEPSFPERVEAWKDTRTGHRPADYKAYKDARTRRIVERMAAYSSHYADRFEVVDSASILTFRDYLYSPDGSAYGIKQKMGQFNLFGRLPIRNLYAAGQSSVLPGLLGAMMSSFIVIRTVLGKDTYGELVEKRLG